MLGRWSLEFQRKGVSHTFKSWGYIFSHYLTFYNTCGLLNTKKLVIFAQI